MHIRNRPLRFGLHAARPLPGEEWRRLARAAEAAGFSALTIPDHLVPTMSPFAGAAAALAATERAACRHARAQQRPAPSDRRGTRGRQPRPAVRRPVRAGHRCRPHEGRVRRRRAATSTTARSGSPAWSSRSPSSARCCAARRSPWTASTTGPCGRRRAGGRAAGAGAAAGGRQRDLGAAPRRAVRRHRRVRRLQPQPRRDRGPAHALRPRRARRPHRRRATGGGRPLRADIELNALVQAVVRTARPRARRRRHRRDVRPSAPPTCSSPRSC